MSEDIEKIKIVEVCGEHCVGVDEGNALFDKIEPLLQSKEKVNLDFSSVKTITSSFLNASIGRLFGSIKDFNFEPNLIIIGLDEDDKKMLELVIYNAKEHFAKNAKEKDLEKDIIERMTDEENQ